MKHSDIVDSRLSNQHITWHPFVAPHELVSWLGAVQAQDYDGAKWGLGLRLKGITDGEVERAFKEGQILRTHVLRPTWHFVAPEDIRWMLELSAPRIKKLMSYSTKLLGLNQTIYDQANTAIVKALKGGHHATRQELVSVLKAAGIVTSGSRMAFLMANAELDQVVCSGARRGKTFTWALLDERVPKAKKLTRDESLAELARRYFTSRGPATLHDFKWWSGLMMKDAKAALALNDQLLSEVIDGTTYWMAPSTTRAKTASPMVHLLPTYDEYIVAYQDRAGIVDPQYHAKVPLGNVIFNPVVIIDGLVVGTWKRTIDFRVARLEFHFLRPLRPKEEAAVDEAIERYRDYLCMSLMRVR